MIERRRRELLGLKVAGHIVTAIALSIVALAAMTWLYMAAPEPTEAGDLGLWGYAAFGAVSLTIYILLALGAVLRLRNTKRPFVEGSLFVVIMAALIILVYSWLYVAMSGVNPASFTEPLSKTTAVYFTVTVLATVGFGDITPSTDTARLVVTSQMLLGFTVITLAIRIITSSASTAAKSQHRRQQLERRAAAHKKADPFFQVGSGVSEE
ncbi:MAG: ion channel [Candidatus Nanopelagicales bacterium]